MLKIYNVLALVWTVGEKSLPLHSLFESFFVGIAQLVRVSP